MAEVDGNRTSISRRTFSIESLLESGLEVLHPGAGTDELATIRAIIDPVAVEDDGSEHVEVLE